MGVGMAGGQRQVTERREQPQVDGRSQQTWRRVDVGALDFLMAHPQEVLPCRVSNRIAFVAESEAEVAVDGPIFKLRLNVGVLDTLRDRGRGAGEDVEGHRRRWRRR